MVLVELDIVVEDLDTVVAAVVDNCNRVGNLAGCIHIHTGWAVGNHCRVAGVDIHNF